MELPHFKNLIRHSISAYITGVFPEWDGVMGLYGTKGKLFVYDGKLAEAFDNFQWHIDLMTVERKKTKGRLQKWIIIRGSAVGSQLTEIFDECGISRSFSAKCDADLIGSYKKMSFPVFDPMKSEIDINIVPNGDRVPDTHSFDERCGELLTMLLLARSM